jgi:nucleoid-associated protein YgaU
MNHAEVRDRMELAAIEPEGLDRLMAGDTPEAVGIAGHLAGCPACLDELGRLRRTATLVRLALESGAPTSADEATAAAVARAGTTEEPRLPPELRERTLAFVRDLGVQRPVITLAEAAAMAGPPPATPAAAPSAPPASSASGIGGRFLRPAAWAASLAAAVVISVLATSLLLGNGNAGDDTAQADLTRLATWSIDVARAPDARQVALRSPSGAATAGLLAFVPSNGQLVVSARDLAVAPAGKEYRCWMEIAGGRTVVGKMHFAGGIAYWVGPVRDLGAVASGTRFGVSLVDAAASSAEGDPVLLGTL